MSADLADFWQQYFDASWYLQTYADVASAGADPYQHFVNFGQIEGRLPCELVALQLEANLWRHDSAAFNQLNLLLDNNDLHAALAAVVLSKWLASWGEWEQVAALLPKVFQVPQVFSLLPAQQPWLLAFTASWRQDLTAAADLLQHPLWPEDPNKTLARAMLWPIADRQHGLHQIWQQIGLDCPDVYSDVLPPKRAKQIATTDPLVSVIVTAFNAASTVRTALCGLLTQSWKALEILVVDDGSTDETPEIVQSMAKEHPQIRLLQQVNSGTYVARNLGLRHARGEFITTHDADDWSHPQKIARQVQALLQNPAAVASVSDWVRCSSQLEFQRWRVDDGWIYRNVSSLMFRREVHHRLGFWDRVAVNADTEFYYRIRQAFGAAAIVEALPGIPLALGRVDSQSLSQAAPTHLRTMYHGVRQQYHAAAVAWQQRAASLYLSASPLRRPFAVPERICRGTPEQLRHNRLLLLSQSSQLDAKWYFSTYPQACAAGLSAADHYLTIGAEADFDPGPAFSTADYRQQHQLAAGVNPLLHFLAVETDKLALRPGFL